MRKLSVFTAVDLERRGSRLFGLTNIYRPRYMSDRLDQGVTKRCRLFCIRKKETECGMCLLSVAVYITIANMDGAQLNLTILNSDARYKQS
jgi:hypothetical protein